MQGVDQCSRVGQFGWSSRFQPTSGKTSMLRPGCREIVADLEERERSLRRKRGLRLIQYVDSLFEAIGEQRDERFSMGLLV
jgi:hypothetical protein